MTNGYISIGETFSITASKFPEKTGLIFLGTQYSYSHLERLSDAVAGSLYNRGVSKGDRVIIYAPHCPQWVIAWLAIQKLGAVAVPITHFYGPKDVVYIANDSGAETIFCTDTNFGYVNKILADTPLKNVIVTGIADLLPNYKKIAGMILDRIPNGRISLGGKVVSFVSLLREKMSAPTPKFTGNDLAEILYTGGTTGLPKGVPITNILFLSSVQEQRKASSAVVPIGEDIIIQAAPLYHALGQLVGFGCLLTGETVILLPKICFDAIFHQIQRYKAKSIMGTPTMFKMMMEHDRLERYNLSSLKYAFTAGDVLPREIANQWLKKFGHPISPGYGATETCGGVALTPAGQPVPAGSAGKLVPFQEIMIVDSDSMEPVPDGSTGELLVSSAHMVTGYWNKPEETALHFINLNGKLWYKTGDMVRVDQDEWLYFVDRSVDLIKHKGYRIAASKIDNALQEHPAVIAACTIGVADPDVGERIKAFVVLKDDVRGVSAQELIKWCSARLVNYEVPHYIEFRDMLPKSKVGKILRKELRSEERRKVQAS